MPAKAVIRIEAPCGYAVVILAARHSRNKDPVVPEVQLLPIDTLRPGRRNPRLRLPNVRELADSLQAHGVLQPIVVRPLADGKYEVIAGHRRLEAARLLEWTTMPALVRFESDDDAYLLTLVENLQRADLSAREQAAALEVLVRERGWSTHEVAAAIKRSQAYVSKRLRVFEDPILAPAVIAGKLTLSAAEELLVVPQRRRFDLMEAAIEGHWDQIQVRAAAQSSPNSGRAETGAGVPGLRRRIQDLRAILRDVKLNELTQGEVGQLRLLFQELAMLARSQPGRASHRVFPPLPPPRSQSARPGR